MPKLEYLKARYGEVLTPEKWNEMIDKLQETREAGAVTYEGYVLRDLIPVKDLMLNLGIRSLRFLEVHAGYGYFAYGIYPPPPAVWYGGMVERSIWPETDMLLNLGFKNLRWKQVHSGYGYFTEGAWVKDNPVLTTADLPKMERIGFVTGYSAPDMADIFSPDLSAPFDGRVRTKIIGDRDFYAYIKWYPPGVAAAIIAALNAGATIPLNAWHEFDFTVMKDDYVNVRVSPVAVVTVAVFGILGA